MGIHVVLEVDVQPVPQELRVVHVLMRVLAHG